VDEAGQPPVISDEHVCDSCGNGVVEVTNILRMGALPFKRLRIKERESDADRDLYDLDFQKAAKASPLAIT